MSNAEMEPAPRTPFDVDIDRLQQIAEAASLRAVRVAASAGLDVTGLSHGKLTVRAASDLLGQGGPVTPIAAGIERDHETVRRMNATTAPEPDQTGERQGGPRSHVA